tara:strand:- start:380 stop:802 length:423 start_codon:yes stop_codon:yes gene_type:complete
MAHFAKLGIGNKVEQVIVISNNDAPTEQAGVNFINNLFGTNDIWKQTSYNTRRGIYYEGNIKAEDQSKAFRKNFAGIGSRYDENLDAFIEPQPHLSWVLNKESCSWEPPVPYPDDGIAYNDGGKIYKWDETSTNWVLINS